MNFWIYAIALLLIPATIISWPLFTGTAKERITGLFIFLMIPLAGIMLYQDIGTPEAINQPTVTVAQQAAQQSPAHAAQQGQMDDLVTSLQQRMAESPDDPDGWLILGRSLKTMQRYAEAETALSNAYRLLPNNAMVMVELAETMLFESGQPSVSPEALQLISSALAIDPNQQKALWLMGMASAQDGDELQAITYWKKLLGQLDPASGAATAVTKQIEMAQTRIGAPETAASGAVQATVKPAPVVQPAATQAEAPPPVAAGFGVPVNISIASDLSANMSGNATLFVFIHPVGAAGMPLAVKRLAPRGFPIALNFTDADLLRPGGSLQDFEQLDISARISMSGIANAASGDIQANRVTLDTNSATTIALHLDQRVP